MQSFSLKSWLSRYADVWILFFLNIFFFKDWNQHAGYMNWDVNFFGDFLHTGNCEKLGIEIVWNKKNNFHEGQRCFAGEKSTVVLIPQCCCSIFVARIKGRFFFLYTYNYVDWIMIILQVMIMYYIYQHISPVIWSQCKGFK